MADKKFLEREQLTDEQLDRVAGGTGGCEPEDPEIMFEDMCEPEDPEIGFPPEQPTQGQEAELFDFSSNLPILDPPKQPTKGQEAELFNFGFPKR